MKKVISLLSISFLLAIAGTGLSAQDCGDDSKQAKSDTQAKILAVKFHADYCGACKALNKPLDDLATKLEGESVKFVKFDFTSDESKKKSEQMASELKVDDVYKKNDGTGYVLLIDSESGETLATLTRKHSVDEMYEIVKKYL